MRDVICVGLAADDTFRYAAASFRDLGLDVDVIDLAQLAHSGEIVIPIDDLFGSTIDLHRQTFRLADYRAAFVRLHEISEAAPTGKIGERSAAIFASLSRLFTYIEMPVVNPPLRDRSNFAKVFHAAELTMGGLLTPRSCLTNDSGAAREFVASCKGGAIFKGASSAKTWATLYDPVLHDERLKLLKSGPVLFQELISGPDVRVHAVGEQLFAELISSEAVDYRTARGNEYQQIEKVPPEVGAGIAVFQERTGIPFLGIDFKIDRRTGEWFVLEANPMPGYDGYDRRAGGRISQAVATLMLSRPATP